MITSSIKELQQVCSRYLARGHPVILDTETTGLNPRTSKLITIQLQQVGYAPFIFDMRHHEGHEVREAFEALFYGELLIIGFNEKFDCQQLKYHLGTAPRRMFDCMLVDQILDGGLSENKEFHLEAVASRHNISVSKAERNYFIDLDQRPDDWNNPFPDEEIAYMEQDVSVLEPIYLEQVAELKKRGLQKVAKLEFQTLVVLAEMELNGLKVDEVKWRAFIERKQQEANELEEQVKKVFGPAILEARIKKFDAELGTYLAWEQARDAHQEQLKVDFNTFYPDGEGWGKYKQLCMKEWREQHPNPGRPRYDETVNIGSQQQMVEAFEVMRIPAKDFKEENLKMLEDDYPAIRTLVQYKHKRKLVDAFGERLLAMIDPVDGRIHTNFRQIIDTGRMASAKPNLMQIPSKGMDGKELRTLFVADPGHKLVINDYPGIEDRILTYLSGDVQKRRIFDEGLDSHTETARMLFGLSPIDDVRCPQPTYNGKSYRDVAKELNYGLMYGLSPFRLAKKLGITTEKAEKVHERYFTVYAGVRDFLAKSREDGIRELASRTILGRPRYYSLPEKPEWPCEDYRQKLRDYERAKGRVGRQAANATIQGTSADMMKLALVKLYSYLPETAKILLCVHDEIIVQAREEEAADVARLVERAMQEACNEMLPGFPVDCSGATISDHWEKG